MTEQTSLPVSARYVRYVIDHHDNRPTQQQIIEETGLSPRTVRFALQRLDEAGEIDSRPSLTDARQSRYWTADE